MLAHRDHQLVKLLKEKEDSGIREVRGRVNALDELYLSLVRKLDKPLED